MILVGKVFDDSFNLRRIIDVYSSFIWNECYIGYGDFQLKFPMGASSLDYIQEGWYLSIDQSDKFMFIEHIGIETNTQNGNYAIVEGRSLESILLRRFIRDPTILSGNFQTGIMRLVQSNMLSAAAANRRIPRLTFTPSTDTRITALTVDAEYTSGDELYDAVTGLCDYAKIGFKIVPNFDDKTFEMSLYSGDDRSYKQDSLPWVVFSSKYENLKSSNMDLDTRELKNAAIVENRYTKTVTDEDGNTHQVEVVMVEEVNPEVSGLERRELFISCSIEPSAVDKDRFGKPTDRVNIRDYQVYALSYFDSARYEEDCAVVNVKYSSIVGSPGTKQVWAQDLKVSYGTDTITIKDGLTTNIKPSSKIVSTKSRAASSAPVDKDKPDWLDNHGNTAWTLVTVQESADEWRARNEKNFSKWERALPNRSKYEKWEWDFPTKAKELEYQAALEAAQAEIDAEYAAAVQAEEDKVRAQMRTLGEVELANYSTITNFNGEVDTNVQFLYGRDYFMGDIVQVVNQYDFQATTRMISVLFSEEEGEGFKIIPSFESDDPSEVDI